MKTERALIVLLAGLWLLAALSAQQPGSGVIGWYNGEWQSGIPGLANWYLGPDRFARVYDEFEVPDGGWTIVGVFSDNGLYQFPPVTHAAWEIRRDMAPQRSGRVLAKDISPAAQKPDPSVTPDRYPAHEAAKHFRIQVDGLQVRLPAGRYWLSVAPVGDGESFLSATRGAGAIGTGKGGAGLALVHGLKQPDFVPADVVAGQGRGGIAQHFSQGVVIAK